MPSGVYVRKSKNTWTPERRREYDRKWNSDRLKVRRERLDNYKLNVGCEICGYDKHPAALDFHHKDPTLKKFNISNSLPTRNWDRILEEIEKCDIICANCHRALHNKEGDYN